MALHVLDHHDGIVDDEAHREHDGQQREEIDGEAGDEHQEHGADERDRNRDDGNEHRPNRSEEEEDHDDHDQQGLGECREHFLIASLMYSVESYGIPAFIPTGSCA